MNQDKYLDTISNLAKEAGKLLRDMRKTAVSVHTKGFRDLVTEADIAAQSLIVEAIQAQFPNDLIVAEETLSDEIEAKNGSGTFYQDPTWIIDPLDGTTNYSRRLPMYAVCIAVAWDGVVQVSAVYLPVMDELFTAVRAQGAWLNGDAIKISDPSSLAEALFAVDWGRTDADRARSSEIVERLLPKVRLLRGIGSAAAVLVWIANQQLDLYLNFNLKVWDIAAPGLILQEAGGVMSGLDGRSWQLDDETTWALASNGRIHNTLLKITQLL